ncbi:LysR family transcriptional regulator [Paraglaciecola sp. 20A4]|uniref:LysR family transcriptional regulator n=1 Tax=Paraglaciecola sp. 20A4 TaxID=2687288 RepID=UPI0014093A23|nr:LysR family transcriptional regulator [Paraglaciecola sp. 20A4]
MNWTVDQLQAFVTAAHLGSFSSAARQLNKAQSRVSSAIANLEIDLGIELFDRTPRYPVLTELGAQMLPEAEFVLAQCQRFDSRAQFAAKHDVISLRITMDEALPIETTSTIFTLFGQKFPHVNLVITSGSRDDVANAVAKKRADIGLMLSSTVLPMDVEFESLGYFKKILIFGMSHPLAKFETVSRTQLQGHRQLVLCNRSGEGREDAFSPNHWYIDSYYVICDLAVQNQGWAMVPEHIADSNWFAKHIHVRSCDQMFSGTMLEVGVVKRNGHSMGHIEKWFIEQLKDLIAK